MIHKKEACEVKRVFKKNQIIIAALAVMMAVILPAFFSRTPNWANKRASAEPVGRGRVKRLPGFSLGKSMNDLLRAT